MARDLLWTCMITSPLKGRDKKNESSAEKCLTRIHFYVYINVSNLINK